MAINPDIDVHTGKPDAPTPRELDSIFDAQRKAFALQPYTDAAYRLQKLKALQAALARHGDALCDAVSRDYGYRSPYETLHAEVYTTIEGIRYLRKRLKRWMKPQRRSVSLLMQPASARVEYQPLGVVGIIVPWNYPIMLAISPLCYALAAGNRVMLKMSEFAPATAAVISTMLADVFAPDEVAVITGDASVGQAFSHIPFDHLMFTGSTHVGSMVMQAAAENLTPVTLELGGKTPVILDAGVDMATACERICFGKALNAGQTCVSPDYILCPHGLLDDFVEAFRAAYLRQYPQREGYPDHSCIINERHYTRLAGLLDDARTHGANIIEIGTEGVADSSLRRMPMQLVLAANARMKLMQEEIFGPILPVIGYGEIDDAIEFVNKRPRPLSLAVFSTDAAVQKKILSQTHSGSVCLNDTVFHVPAEDLPFGGIGSSGMGQYHGHEGFLRFSHAKAVFRRPGFNSARLLYPPYGTAIQRLVRKLFLR
jgi:coniferyl-aldehyde dehydrogenase